MNTPLVSSWMHQFKWCPIVIFFQHLTKPLVLTSSFQLLHGVLLNIWQISLPNHPHMNFKQPIFMHVFPKHICCKLFEGQRFRLAHGPHLNISSRWTFHINVPYQGRKCLINFIKGKFWKNHHILSSSLN